VKKTVSKYLRHPIVWTLAVLFAAAILIGLTAGVVGALSGVPRLVTSVFAMSVSGVVTWFAQEPVYDFFHERLIERPRQRSWVSDNEA